MGNFTWRGPEYMEYLNGIVDARLEIAAQGVATYMRNLIGTDYPPASQPGAAPHRRTGELQGSIKVVKPRPLQRLVGANTRYAMALELGRTVQPPMAHRPFILRSFLEAKQQTVDTITGGGGQRNIQPFAASFAPGFGGK